MFSTSCLCRSKKNPVALFDRDIFFVCYFNVFVSNAFYVLVYVVYEYLFSFLGKLSSEEEHMFGKYVANSILRSMYDGNRRSVLCLTEKIFTLLKATYC